MFQALTLCALFSFSQPSSILAKDLQLILEWDGQSAPIVGLDRLKTLCKSALATKGLKKGVRLKLYLRQAEVLYYLNDPAGSVRSAKHALLLDHNNVRAKWRLGLALLDDPKSRKDALVIAKNLMKKSPRTPEGHHLAGVCYLRSGAWRQCIAYFNKVIIEDKTWKSAFFGRGFARYKLKEYEGCLKDIEAAMKLPPDVSDNDAQLYAIYGLCLANLARFAEAVPFLQRAWNEKPSGLEVGHALWICLVESEQSATALALTKQMVKRHPKEDQTHWMRARSMLRFGLLKEAAKEAELAVRLQPRSGSSITAIGIVWEQQGKFKHALAAYGRAIEQGVPTADPLLRAAFIFATCPDPKFRNGKRAVKWAKKCFSDLKLPKYRRWALVVLALGHAELGQSKIASATITRAIAMSKSDPDFRKRCERLAKLFSERKAYRHDPSQPRRRIFSLEPTGLLSYFRGNPYFR